MIQVKKIPQNLIGRECEARDDYYGYYRGIIAGNHKNYSEPRVKVLIIECIKEPSTSPILCEKGNPLNLYVHREAYKPGTIQHFSLKEVFPL